MADGCCCCCENPLYGKCQSTSKLKMNDLPLNQRDFRKDLARKNRHQCPTLTLGLASVKRQRKVCKVQKSCKIWKNMHMSASF